MSVIDTLEALAITVRNETKKEANSSIRIGDLFLAIIYFLKGLASGQIRQEGVDTYNDTFGGKTSLLNSYPMPQIGWSVLVRTDETYGDKATLRQWNGTTWVNLETAVYEDNIMLSGGTEKTGADLDVAQSSNRSKYFAYNNIQWRYRANNTSLYVYVEALFNYLYITLTDSFLKSDGTLKNIFIKYVDVNSGTYRVVISVEQDDTSYVDYTYTGTSVSGSIKFPAGELFFGLSDAVPTNATTPMTVSQSSLNTSLVRQASLNVNVPIINSSINKIKYTNKWKYRTTLQPVRIADLFLDIRLEITDSLTIGTRFRKMHFSSIEQVSGQYFVRIRVETGDNTFSSYQKQGTTASDYIDFPFGRLYYTLINVSKLPASVNIDASYDEGAITEEYISIVNAEYNAKLLASSNALISYTPTASVERGPDRFWIYKQASAIEQRYRFLNINGAKKGFQYRLVEVYKPSSTIYQFVKRSDIIEFDGKNDFKEIDFSIAPGNYLGLQLVKGTINIASPTIPTGVIRCEGYVGNIDGKTQLDASVDSIYVAGDYVLFACYVAAPSLKEKSRYYDSVIPFAGNYKQTILNSSEQITYLGNPITLHSPDGYDMFLHPNVLYFPDKLFGYKYWMAITPFPTIAPLYDDYYENPCIYASNNGLDWVQPGTNPIDAIEDEHIVTRGYMSDPVLCIKNGVLECWYRRTTVNPTIDINRETELLRKTTTDGVTWSAREVMVPDMNYINTFEFTAPKIYWDGSKYICYYTEYADRGYLYRAESIDGKNWTNFVKCEGVIEHVHADVAIINNVFYAIVFTTAGGEKLRLYTSTDGLNFSNGRILLEPDDFTFYSDGFYKSTILHNGKDFLVYFTARVLKSDGRKIRKIGLMKGKDIDSLQVVDAKGVGMMNINGFLNLDSSDRYSAKIKIDTDKWIMYDKVRKMIVSVDAVGNTQPLININI